jgi:hypothetical protein
VALAPAGVAVAAGAGVVRGAGVGVAPALPVVPVAELLCDPGNAPVVVPDPQAASPSATIIPAQKVVGGFKRFLNVIGVPSTVAILAPWV